MTEFRILCEWDGEAFVPANQVWAGRADKALVVGQRYFLTEVSQRSKTSHDHYFAAVGEVFKNLPEHLAQRFSDPDHLRAYALIKTGFYVERVFIASSKAEAVRVAHFLKTGQRQFAIISIADNVVVERVAQSQSYAAMGKHRFQESKDKVLDFLADLIGVQTPQLQRESA
jgi:hypothetical protein